MHIDPYILTFSAATVIATIWVGFWSARRSKTAHDFYVAGRSVSVGWNASAISGEYLSAASFMGVAGMVMSSGYDALWYPVCYACGYLFLLLFIAGPLRRFGAYTIPDFAEGRFDSPLFRKIAVVFVLFIGFFYTMPQMKGAGTTLAYIFPGLPYWAGVVLVGAVITLNVALGGMKGITLVQAFQYWAKMFAISVPIFVLMAVYGDYGKQLEVENLTISMSSVRSNWEFNPTRFSGYEKGKSPHVTTNSGGIKIAFEDAELDAALLEIEDVFCKHFTLVHQISYTPPLTFEILAGDSSNAWREVQAAFARHGLNFIERSSNEVYMASAGGEQFMHYFFDHALAERVRKPLPDKAPKDETWLSPFGPLTTKAAKAAKPKWSFSVPHESESTSLDRIRPGFYSIGRYRTSMMGLAATNYTGKRLAREYIAAVLEAEEPTSNIPVRLDESSTLAGLAVPVTRELSSPPKEMAEAILNLLRAHDITVVREPGNVFKAFHKSEAVLKPVDPLPYSLLYTYSLIIALVCGTAGLPHILVRFYTNPDGVAAKRTTMWVMILIGVFYLFPPVFGVMGRNLMPQLYEGVGAKGTDKVVLELPRILNDRGAHAAGVSSAAARSGELVVGPPPNAREPRALPGRIPWGSILSGITCAGAFAAFMSTFSGLLVSMTGALAHDVYGRMLRPKSTPEQRLRAFKICAVIVGAVAILLGMQVEPFQINFMVGQAFAIAAASYFPLLFMSAWWRGMTMRGAATGMLAGGLLALTGITLTSFSDLKWLPLDAFWAGHPLLRILCEQPAIWTVPLAITLMIVVSKMTRAGIPSDVRMKMLVLHAPEKLGLKQEYIQEHQHGH